MADPERIEELEAAVRQLRQEMAELRAAVYERPATPTPGVRHVATAPARPSAAGARAPTAGAASPAPGRSRTGSPLDLEALVGRYGTIALATLTIIVGAGAFLTWAIENGLLGPRVRLALGAVAAIAVAVLGVWLRSRGTPRYGNMLLGLALALVHVDAWGAGPSLHVVSSGIALVIAAGASAALASLALALDEASLFAIGIGGAFVAPFVVSAGGGRLFVLLAYGLVVLASGAYVIRRREWPVAAGLMVLGCLVYVVAGTDLAAALSGWRAGYAPALFALCCTWCVALWGGAWQRRTVAAAYLTIALVAFVAAILTGHAPLAVVLGIPLGATLTAYALARLAQMRGPGRAVLAAAVPLGFLGAAVWAMHAAGDGSRALVAAFWTVLATGAAWDAVPDVRPLHVMVAGLASAAGIVLALHGRLVAMVLALAVHVAVFSVLLRRARSRALLVPLAAALALAVAMSFILLARRPAFAYVPFFTPASAAALATAAACWWLWRQSRDMPRNGAGGPGVDLRWPTGALAALVTFFWCHAELSHAFTPDVAIFLLVVYFALAGVAAIFVGRRYALTAARAAGLALALYAALKAILRAWNYGAVGLKVGSCVLAGAFLFAVAYWYRGRSDVERA